MNRSMFQIELEQDIDAMAALAMDDKVAFAMNRRKGFGASDSSIILGVNKWTTPEQLIAQKNTDGITKEELEVGKKIVLENILDINGDVNGILIALTDIPEESTEEIPVEESTPSEV